MYSRVLAAAFASALFVAPTLAAAAPPAPEAALVTPSQVVAAAPVGDWRAISPDELLVMDLAADAGGKPRRVIIQLLPPPFSQGWVANIRKLAAAHWWDGLSVNRVQDNYVAQWGDAEGEDHAKAKPLPAGLAKVPEDEYVLPANSLRSMALRWQVLPAPLADPYAVVGFNGQGWPQATDGNDIWPIHCYATVGVGRNLSPDTGSGAELYAVIGTPPRQLDRNIAVVGRVIEGIEHLSSLPRGTGDMGFYAKASERVPIVSVRLGSEVPGLPRYEYLATDSPSFARYADLRANRHDAFYIHPASGVDICNLPVPVRRTPG